MAKPYKIPDFKKLYPETKDEIIAVLKISERKMQYQEYDLKNEQIVIDMEKQTVTVIPSKGRFLRADERSRCTVQGRRTPDTEEQAILRMEIKQLYRAILCLSEDDRYLIVQLYFEERTERCLAKELGCSQNAVNKRRQNILKRLRHLIENF